MRILCLLVLTIAASCADWTTPGVPSGLPHQQTWDAALGACRLAARCTPWLAVQPGDDLVYRCADGLQRSLTDATESSWAECEQQLAYRQTCGDWSAPDACLPWWPDGVVSQPEEP